MLIEQGAHFDGDVRIAAATFESAFSVGGTAVKGARQNQRHAASASSVEPVHLFTLTLVPCHGNETFIVDHSRCPSQRPPSWRTRHELRRLRKYLMNRAPMDGNGPLPDRSRTMLADTAFVAKKTH